ncbi:MAG: hypothetical protein IPP22_11935 [Nitrosomonas sp.]|nr:hypothetical protein [Nitrosomonas sp.]
MEWHEMIGFVAGFGTTFAALPDLLRMLKQWHARGMNPTMAAIMGTFQVVWVYYGVLIASNPVIVWNIIAVMINCFMVGTYFCFTRKEKNGPSESNLTNKVRLYERSDAIICMVLGQGRFRSALFASSTESCHPIETK